jgi:hypothetical protein
VNEHVVRTLTFDETETLGGIEELNFTLGHVVGPPWLEKHRRVRCQNIMS